MTREQIEKAATESCVIDNSIFNPKYVPYYEHGFIDGANWRINAVWHNASERPNKNQLVLFECRKTYGKGYSVNFGENYELMKNVIVRWAYIIDLLPGRKDE